MSPRSRPPCRSRAAAIRRWRRSCSTRSAPTHATIRSGAGSPRSPATRTAPGCASTSRSSRARSTQTACGSNATCTIPRLAPPPSGRPGAATHRTPELRRFLEAWLPPPPARVLEVGCGDGALTRELLDRGYAMTAIDPEPPDGEPFVRSTLEDFEAQEPFDAAVAIRSLHHLHDLIALAGVRAALAARFTELVAEPTPYLAREADREDLVEREREAIAGGELEPLGMRLVYELRT